MQAKPYVLLDFDGPIVDLFDGQSGLTATRSIVNVARNFGVEASHFMGSPLFLTVWRDIRKRIEISGQDVPAFDGQIHAEIEKHEIEILRNTQADTCAIEVLYTSRQFSQGVAVVSNNSKKAIVNWAVEQRLDHLIDFVSAREGENPFAPLKPQPDLIKKALKTLGCRATNAVFIGDTKSDYLSSQCAGVEFVGVKTHHTDIADAESTAWILNSRLDICCYLKGEFESLTADHCD